MEKTRRQFTPQQKVAILREHLELKVHRYFDLRLGGRAWKGTGGLGCRSFGPQEPVRAF
jgi:hypothetical protein